MPEPFRQQHLLRRRRSEPDEHDRHHHVGQRVEGENGGDPDSADQHSGDRGPDRSRKVHRDAVERRRGSHLRPADQLAHERLIRRDRHRHADAEQHRHREQQGGRQQIEHRQQDEHGADCDLKQLHPDQQPPPIQDVGHRARGQSQRESRQHGRRLHEPDKRRRIRLVDQQPLGTHRLHPGADQAEELSDPECPERRHPKRRPRRRLQGNRTARHHDDILASRRRARVDPRVWAGHAAGHIERESPRRLEVTRETARKKRVHSPFHLNL